MNEPSTQELIEFVIDNFDGPKWKLAVERWGGTKNTWRNRYRRALARNMDAQIERSYYAPNRETGRRFMDKQTGAILIIPDTHAPAMHPKAVEFLDTVANHYAVDTVYHIGDLADFYAFSRWDTIAAAMPADEELLWASAQLQPLFKRFPKAKLTIGNHDDRLLRNKYMAMSANELSTGETALHDWIVLPKGWEVGREIRLELMAGGPPVYITHRGRGGKTPAANTAAAWGTHVVTGHYHSRMGTYSHGMREFRVWGMDVGCLIDTRSYMLDYIGISADTALGCGVITTEGHFIAVPLPQRFMVAT